MPRPKKPPPRWSERAKTAVSSHPKIAWGTLAAIVGILGVVVPWGIALEARYQRVEQAKADLAAVHSEMASHEKVDRRTDAWQSVGQSRIETLILRNRVNECNVQRAAKRVMTGLELSVCQQYDDELKQGQNRLDQLQREARALSQ